jgi:formyltetrahydrofolate deformylase
MSKVYRLVISCPDQIGIVAKVSSFLAQYQGTIVEANHYADQENGHFFMRNEISSDNFPLNIDEFSNAFSPIAKNMNMEWWISDSQIKKKVVLMVSKDSHCLADILNRWHSGDLDCDIPCIISNHNDLRSMVEWHDIPFFHVPVDRDNKKEHFDKVTELVKSHHADCVVLARYMQILPSEICQQWQHKVINIHHSFLPSFVGAKPYHQAAQRGVKLIGATSHYVTEELDAGPIIDQDVVRISHKDQVPDMVRLGKDVERTVLARALRYHLEDRVVVFDNKTVVF